MFFIPWCNLKKSDHLKDVSSLFRSALLEPRVRARLPWQPGLDVRHLSGDSCLRGCEVTPRHICRGAGDPCNQPEGPQPYRLSPGCVTSPSTPTPPLQARLLQVTSRFFFSGVARWKQQMHSLGRFGHGKHNETQEPGGREKSNLPDFVLSCYSKNEHSAQDVLSCN